MGARILVVEHRDSDHGHIKGILARADHELLFARDSASGIAAARRHRPHLVVCDIAPPSSGVQLLHTLRRDPSFDKMPVVAVTWFSEPGERDSLLNLGFADVIPKPLSDTFASQIENFLPR